VLDEPHALSSQALGGLQNLLIEHDRTTGEQILVAVFASLDDEELVDYTNRVFAQWKIGRRGKDNGVLLALYWKEHQARIEVGYGLEPLLTDAKSKRVISEFLVPELKADHPDRALGLAALEILRAIESPLVESGRAEQLLRSGGLRGSLEPPAPVTGKSGPGVWGVVAFIIFLIAFNQITSRDAHFTRAGWFRPRAPFRRRLFGGGGGGGPWFGGGGGWGGGSGGSGGGFSGGGGSSGGGGASGSW
jgi:uncharacterized protein